MATNVFFKKIQHCLNTVVITVKFFLNRQPDEVYSQYIPHSTASSYGSPKDIRSRMCGWPTYVHGMSESDGGHPIDDKNLFQIPP